MPAKLAGGLPSVAVTIVTHNSARFIRKCLQHVFELAYPNLAVILIDNASTDNSATILDEYRDRATVVCNRQNVGFAGGQNQAIALAHSDWVLVLNPDVRLTPDFLAHAVQAGETDQRIGMVSGKLLSFRDDFEIPTQPEFDSTGIYMTPSLRHFDRGSKQKDQGQYETEEYVFGVTGAAALYRRAMLDDLKDSGGFFDSDFFAYREDVDLAWRAQWLGWRCLYMPKAVAYHVRSVLSSNRRRVAASINMHSVKNRFLMRVKNATWMLYRRFGAAITARDLVVFGGCVLYEFRSLEAFWLVLRYLPRTWQKRRSLMRRRRSTEAYIVSWFSNEPVSFPTSLIAAKDERR